MESNSASHGFSTLPLLNENYQRRRGMLPPREVKSDSIGFSNDTTTSLPSDYQCHVLFGDHWDERYRLATFAQFPRDSPVKIWDLARSGFFYAGYKDRVQCFSCGMEVENWVASDNALSSMWHLGECDMVRGRDTRNIPRPGRSTAFYDLVKEAIEWSRNLEPLGRTVRSNLNFVHGNQEVAMEVREDVDPAEEQPQPAAVAEQGVDDDVGGASQMQRRSDTSVRSVPKKRRISKE